MGGKCLGEWMVTYVVQLCAKIKIWFGTEYFNKTIIIINLLKLKISSKESIQRSGCFF